MGSEEASLELTAMRAGSMSLGKRMTLGAGLSALLLVAIVIVNFASLSALDRVERARRDVLDARLSEQRLSRALNEALLSGGATTSRDLARTQVSVLDTAFQAIAASPDHRELADAFGSKILPLWGRIKPLATAMIGARTLAAEDDADQIALGRIIALSGQLSAELDRAVEATDVALSAQRKRIQFAIVAGGLLAAFAVVLLLAFLHRSVRRALGGTPERMAAEIATLAQGDLATAVALRAGDTSSPMSALEGMRGSLSTAVGEIRGVADRVRESAEEIARGNMELSGRTEEQAAALEQAAASMEEMTTTVAQNADNARRASELAAGAATVARRGGEAVLGVMETMRGITASSEKIADIVGVIDGIAFQTNILALNAAVEAARAGEQGRGFAVVAGEVRVLAQRSAEAARDIRGLIAESVSRVDAGARQVGEAGRTADEVVESVGGVSALIAEIAAASREQSQGIEQVSETVAQLEKVTQQNAALAAQAGTAATALDDQAGLLAEAVGAFRLHETGNADLPVPVPAVQWRG